MQGKGNGKGVTSMVKKIMALALALSFLGVMFADSALAKRRCPPGQEDINNVCVPK